MGLIIREFQATDLEHFVDFSEKLSRFNRDNHHQDCKYDNYEMVLCAIREKAKSTFETESQEIMIYIAELDGLPRGYALGRIYIEEATADNGTGKIGLIDELYIDETARGHGIGVKLVSQVIDWLKSKGIQRVKLHAYSWNENAKVLYEKLGFKEYAVSYEKFL